MLRKDDMEWKFELDLSNPNGPGVNIFRQVTAETEKYGEITGWQHVGAFRIETDPGIPDLELSPQYRWRVTALYGNSGAGRLA